MTDHSIFNDYADTDAGTSTATVQKWGGLASFLMAPALMIALLVYLMGNLRDALGTLAYALGDFLYGPVWAACLVTVVFALRERIGERAPRRMTLALLAAFVAASAFVAVACIRSANRHYHIIHPELHLESSVTVLIVWTTLVAGLIGTAWHLLGWAWILVGSAGWTSRSLPRVLSVLYLLAGIVSLFVYALPESEGGAVLLGMVLSIWQGLVLWKAEPSAAQAPQANASQPDQA